MKSVIVAEKLGKSYRLGVKAPRYPTLREAIVGAVKAPFARMRSINAGGDETFWALKDVSFEVQRGEVLGIIGRNGAGKSTLLKILSRITEPTEGRARLRGRVASLLEVGTGFHPELSGRENIFLNGAILGMKRAEIRRKFDQIVDFAEIDLFIDTPVKRYSSGMYVRLAFAVAAHLEPEILIVDEVLAVGDAQFQKKCLGKMQQVAAGEGRTVLFVSHNMPAVRSLCQTCCLLEKGKLTFQGSADEGVSRYLREPEQRELSATARFTAPKDAPSHMTAATVLCDDIPSTQLKMGGRLSFRFDFSASVPVRHPRVGFVIVSPEGERLINVNNHYQPSPEFDPPVFSGSIRVDLGVLPLVAGRYTVMLWYGDFVHDIQHFEEGLSFEVVEHDIWGQGRVPPAEVSHLWWPVTFKFAADETRPADPANSTGSERALSSGSGPAA